MRRRERDTPTKHLRQMVPRCGPPKLTCKVTPRVRHQVFDRDVLRWARGIQKVEEGVLVPRNILRCGPCGDVCVHLEFQIVH